jgi:hypothetical protein
MHQRFAECQLSAIVQLTAQSLLFACTRVEPLAAASLTCTLTVTAATTVTTAAATAAAAREQ